MAYADCLPSDEGSGLKYDCSESIQAFIRLPSDEGSGLKWNTRRRCKYRSDVFPRMREVD